MRRTCILALVCAAALAQAKYIPDPIVQYKIDARLDAKAKTIKGREVIQWRNHTSDTIPDLQFHLYLNAFKNNLSTFFREGGAENLCQALRHVGSLLGRGTSWLAPAPVKAITVLGPQADERPTALIVFYRANFLAADMAPPITAPAMSATTAVVSMESGLLVVSSP